MARSQSPDVWSPPFDSSRGDIREISLFAAPVDEIRIVLLGKTGTGKSRTGCNILGKHRTFLWSLQPQSTTTKCEWRTEMRFGKKIDVVDTPGIFDSERPNSAIQEEIRKCIALTTPGPHAILLCVQMGKFTHEDLETMKHFMKYFGEELSKYVILVFTRADDWEREQHDLGTTTDIETYIQGLPKDPKKFLEKCNNRYILWNNRLEGPDMEFQVQRLLQMIDIMIKGNNGSCYTNEDYDRVEEILQSLLRRNQPPVGIEIGTSALCYESVCSSSDFGNDFESSLRSDLGSSLTERDRAKNCDTFYETVKNLLSSLVERMKDFYTWLRG